MASLVNVLFRVSLGRPLYNIPIVHEVSACIKILMLVLIRRRHVVVFSLIMENSVGYMAICFISALPTTCLFHVYILHCVGTVYTCFNTLIRIQPWLSVCRS